MANADIEKSSYGLFERFLYIFFIPTLFLALLLGVLLTLFDYDVKDSILRLADKIPLVNSVVPDPAPDIKEPETKEAITAGEIEELTGQLARKKAELSQSINDLKQKDLTIEELQTNITKLREEMEEKKLTGAEYLLQIQALASMYGQMSPSKAAPILENLTPSELILILSQMKADARIGVLEKMDPKTAANASIQLKDVVPVDVRAIAALQERLDEYMKRDPLTSSKLNKDELALTFSNMTPKSAATVLLEMNRIDAKRVVNILISMNSQGRSKVLTALADLSKETAANISNKLGE